MTDILARLRGALSQRYSVEREIGRGGMATVYLAKDLRHGRELALKVLDPELTTALGAERFLREIRTTSRLNHPGILHVHDSGEAAGLLYYTMPYVDGESLLDRMKRERPFDIDDAVGIAVAIADALAFAHAHGIVHRDVKPENVLFSKAGHLWVSDFGLARAVHHASHDDLTASGLAVGSPRYMSPEQAAAEKRINGRADIYSLGCVTYEMLTGTPPFTGETLQALIAQHVAQPAPAASAARDDVPPHVSQAVLKAMSKDPSERFATASEFARALAPGIRSVSYSRPFALPLRARLARLSRRTRFTAMAAVVLLVAGLLAVRGGYSARSLAPFTAREAPDRRVIVTPLDNRTGSREFDALGVMTADWLTSGLQSIRAIQVIPTPTALQVFRAVTGDRGSSNDARDPIKAVAAETGAGTVVMGSVYRRGDRLLFRLQVVDVRENKIVETIDDVEAPAADALVGVEEVRGRLMGWFAARYDERISSELEEGARPPLYQAYAAFSEALDHYIENRWDAALPLFLESYRRDSSFAPAVLYASICASNLGQFARSDSLIQIARRSRGELSAYNRAWVDYRSAFLAGRHDEALAAIRTAASLAPDSKAAYNHAVTAFESGRPAEALTVLKRIPPERGPMRGFMWYWGMLGAAHHALLQFNSERETGLTARRLYPQRLFALVPLARSLAAEGDMSSLTRLLDEAERLPADPVRQNYGELLIETAEELRAHGRGGAAGGTYLRAYHWYAANDPGAHVRRARVAYALGRYNEADSLVAELRRIDRENPEFVALAALIAARLGQRDSAAAASDSLVRLRQPYDYGAVTLYRARIAAVLGNREAAVAHLRQALREGLPYDISFHRDLDLESLREYPPFRAISWAQR